MLHEDRIQPLVVINKIDLLNAQQIHDVEIGLDRLHCEAILISATNLQGLNALLGAIVQGKTYCLLGQSGVGKSSILNGLLEQGRFKTTEVREKDNKGRHTTVSRQLILLPSGAIFIDTPGIRELGNLNVEQGLDQTFFEFAEYAHQCRYRDCTHTHESGCAVLEAVNNGKIDQIRYQNYIKLRRESAFFSMTYEEKR